MKGIFTPHALKRIGERYNYSKQEILSFYRQAVRNKLYIVQPCSQPDAIRVLFTNGERWLFKIVLAKKGYILTVLPITKEDIKLAHEEKLFDQS